MKRRSLLGLALGAAAVPLASRFAGAIDYPTRPVRVLVPFLPGSTSDTLARVIGQWLSERLGQSFVVESRPGAAGNMATEAVVRAPPDGYTLLLVTLSNALNATLYESLNFNFIRDIAPVASLMRTPGVMEVNPSFPAKTVPEFIAYAKANPHKVTMASAGNGASSHLAGALFMMMTGIDMVHVPYRGSPAALTDLLGGQVQVMFDNLPTSIEYIKAGKLLPLGVTATKRLDLLPDVPPLADFVPGYETSLWLGIGAPRNTPAEVVAKLNNEINAALADPKIKAQLAALGGTPLPGSPADFSKLIAGETEKWGRVIRTAGIKVE
ncbi:MAG TPA: tripartite tricarboxylate transporter substrate binding protein [Xanthobacteraceae bacterium]|nr:tripartite tricarboxylate transporter substrate binding protein [Xanthobacteraceae bacterium]